MMRAKSFDLTIGVILALLCAVAIVCPASAQQTNKVVATCNASAFSVGSVQYQQAAPDGGVCGATGGTVVPTPLTVTTTDRGGTITSGGVAQAAIALNASRKTWCITNDPAATEVLNVRSNGTASATTGVPLQPGWQACNQPGTVDTSAVSVFGATTGHRWFGSEAQ